MLTEVLNAVTRYRVPRSYSGTRISDESFAKSLPFSQLKLRVGYGLQGNQAVAPFASLPTLAANCRTFFSRPRPSCGSANKGPTNCGYAPLQATAAALPWSSPCRADEASRRAAQHIAN